ncbi:glycosyltransferase family 4 protein [Oceanicaulis sp. UBA2681]|uniref:glycosyltransferase family 4 protein n=1 Tax=Oceanicaulis sp. UBA2681 TaxID=1947007 RepID=UPI0032E51D91|tara:strand:+ start:1673 stop:2860 length:1188 start_codon:yes stop_codon:yes gene_type:complete
MKVLLLHNSYQQRGGEDAVVKAEATLLREAGVSLDVDLVSNHQIQSVGDKLRAGLGVVANRDQAERVRRLVADRGYDVVHIHNFFPLLSPAVHEAAHEAGAAVVQTLHNFRLVCAGALLLRNGAVCEKCLGGSSAWGVVHGCYRNSRIQSLAVAAMIETSRRGGVWKERVNRFIALTEFGRQKFIDAGLTADKIAVKPNFKVRHEHAVKAVPLRSGALFVGRLSAEKGVDVLLDAWKRLPDIPLTIIGDGPARGSLQKSALPNVSFLGAAEPAQVQTEMKRAALLVMPSVCYETFGMTIIEAYSAGLPVLASDLGAMAEIVEPRRTGWLFAPGDADELARTARSLFNDPARLEQAGSNALLNYERNYTPEINLRQLLDIYEKATEDRRLQAACPD